MNRVPIALFPTNPVMENTQLLSPAQLALDQFDWETNAVFERWSQLKSIPISYELSDQEISRRNEFELTGVGGVKTLTGMRKDLNKWSQVRRSVFDPRLYSLSGLKVNYERPSPEQQSLMLAMFTKIFGDKRLCAMPTFNDLLSVVKTRGEKINFVVVKEGASSFELDFAMDHAEGVFLRAYQSMLIRTRSAEHLDSIIVHELGHWHGHQSGSSLYPQWFEELFLNEPSINWSDAIQALAFNPKVLGAPLEKDINKRRGQLAEYCTRIYFEYPYRLLKAGLKAEEISAKVDSIIPGAMDAFMQNMANPQNNH